MIYLLCGCIAFVVIVVIIVFVTSPAPCHGFHCWIVTEEYGKLAPEDLFGFLGDNRLCSECGATDLGADRARNAYEAHMKSIRDREDAKHRYITEIKRKLREKKK